MPYDKEDLHEKVRDQLLIEIADTLSQLALQKGLNERAYRLAYATGQLISFTPAIERR